MKIGYLSILDYMYDTSTKKAEFNALQGNKKLIYSYAMCNTRVYVEDYKTIFTIKKYFFKIYVENKKNLSFCRAALFFVD